MLNYSKGLAKKMMGEVVPIEPTGIEVVEPSGVRLLAQSETGLSWPVYAAMPRPAGRFLLIRRRAAAPVSKGGLIMPDTVKDANEYVINVGQVLAVGPDAFSHEDFMVVRADATGVLRRVLAEPRCRVGDWVLFMRQEQLRVTVYEGDARATAEAQDVHFIPDRAVLGHASCPDQYKFYGA